MSEDRLNLWTFAVVVGLLIFMLLGAGCATIPLKPTYPEHYDEPLIDESAKLGRTTDYGVAVTAWPPPGTSYYKLLEQADGRWRYEYVRPDGSSTWYPGHAMFVPRTGDPRQVWTQRDTLEVW